MEVEIDLNLDEGARTHAHICSNIGMATGMAQSWRSMFEYTVGGIVYGDALFINDQPTYLPRRDELVTLSTELIHLNRNYCLFVPDQTKEEFLEKLIQTKTQLEDLLKTVSLFVNS